MKLYSARVPVIARDLIQKLVEDGDIETASLSEARLDVEAILKEYVRVDREWTDRAKETVEKRGLSYEQFSRVKREFAEERNLSTQEEVIGYLSNQIVEDFMHSQNIDEVYTEEGALRKKIRQILTKHMGLEEDMDHEVRNRIKNLQEGTAAWEVEYQKAMTQIKRKYNAT